MEAKIQQDKNKDILAYNIAKQIREVAKTNCQVEDMLNRIKYQFDRAEVKLADYPISRWGDKIMPQK